MFSIAILLTCFNRKHYTLNCLNSLKSISNKIDLFVVDDGSNDGTFESIRLNFPFVNLYLGNGTLFWNRGMHLAWTQALVNNYDYYIWINDDVELKPGFLEELLKCSNENSELAIVSGIVESDNNEILYGGFDKNKTKIIPDGTCQNITYLNGNIVLIPKGICDNIGILDPVFHHDLGDVEYGMRALKHGFKVISTKKAIGIGMKNSISRERLSNANFHQRFKKLYSPLGSNPKINFYFRKKYFGYFNATAYFLFQHFLNLIPDKINHLLFGNKYCPKY